MKSISRREFIGAAGGVAAAGVFTSMAAAGGEGGRRTRYIAAYDTEAPLCLKACEQIVAVHKRMEIPATFFILARTLLAHPKEYRELLNHPLFEVASHTYDHQMIRDNAFCGRAAPAEQIHKEIIASKRAIEDVFERPCIGLRPGCGFDAALRGAVPVLQLVREAGYRYVSSLLWGPDYSMPALLHEPFHYGADGFPDLWELPGHGWHENLLKDHNGWGPRRVTLWPPAIPESIPNKFVKTPADEFAVNRVFLEKAREEKQTFVSLIWHPWSLHRMDPEMKMLELTFDHARRIGLEPSTYAALHQAVAAEKA
jgi:peptidoglycan/xylan/chitin deacetylase (PgdA/CDA1 family)